MSVHSAGYSLIEGGIQHIRASQLRGIRDALKTTYDELLAEQ